MTISMLLWMSTFSCPIILFTRPKFDTWYLPSYPSIFFQISVILLPFPFSNTQIVNMGQAVGFCLSVASLSPYTYYTTFVITCLLLRALCYYITSIFTAGSCTSTIPCSALSLATSSFFQSSSLLSP